MAQRLRVAAVGEVAENVYLPDERRTLGGISANFAASARAAGADVRLYAVVGDDDGATHVLSALEGVGLDTERVRRASGRTAAQRIRLADDGERIFCGWDPGVTADYRLTDDELRELASFDVVALVASPEGETCLSQGIGVAGPRKVADFSQDAALDGEPDADRWIRPFVDRLTVAFVGGRADHLPRLVGLSEATSTEIVLTAGAAGAWSVCQGRVVHQPAVARRVVDTTGCGDAFQAAFTVARMSGATAADALRAGAERAAVVASRIGG
jgi:fructoselysine 6-kinase